MSNPSNRLYRCNDGRRTGSGLDGRLSGLKEDWQVIEKVLPPDASEWYQVSKEVNKAGHFNHPV
jgi:hypothetical protein